MIEISWAQALAWRMRRHELDPVGTLSAPDVVDRLCGVQAQVASSADLAIRVRSSAVGPGDVAAVLRRGDLIKTWAMRGTLHLLRVEDAGAFLSLMLAGRSWERPSWQRAFGMDPATLEVLRAAVREALDGKTLTREDLVASITIVPGLEHVGEALRSGWGTILKPLAWSGDLCFGPQAGNRVTFMRPDQASERWVDVTNADAAAPVVIRAYLRAYGPATADGFSNWLSRGRIPIRQLRGWFATLGDELTAVEVDGESAFILAEDADDLAASVPSTAVRLLPGFDQFVLGPGTDDGHVVAPGRRSAVSRQSGWIAPVVLRGGVVTGTWELTDGSVRVDWFAEAGSPPDDALEAEIARLAAILGRTLEPQLERSARPADVPA